LFDGITALDLVGPMEAFAMASAEHARANGHASYELVTIGVRRSNVTAESGLVLKPRATLADCPSLDTLMIPGGEGLRENGTNTLVARWIERRATSTRRIATVCTGIYGLAPTGLLDGRRVTTHWRYAATLSQHFPSLRVEADATRGAGRGAGHGGIMRCAVSSDVTCFLRNRTRRHAGWAIEA
jgi:transcriptional regulator GlxA family with amidase domain